MKRNIITGILLFLVVVLVVSQNTIIPLVRSSQVREQYIQNRAPLLEVPYLELPLGAIKPQGWLRHQLQSMSNGLTGNLDEVYSEVVGSRNGWLGGDGDGWERGPYWIDGLLPLAYILNDTQLKAKVQPWIEWTLNNQTEDGYLGPVPFENPPENEPGLQKVNRRDWWPKMVMLKILQQYYNATEDERVIVALTNYFKYQLKELPNRPLDYLSLWANRRGGDNLQVVYWLYNITGDQFLLELGDLVQKQTFPWTEVFLSDNISNQHNSWHYSSIKRYPFDSTEINSLSVSKIGGFHTVNFAQGLKEPIIYYQKDMNPLRIKAVKKALHDVNKYHGQPQGMYGGDEPLHGTDPVQGVEFCSISEIMFSLESILKITGDMDFADHLEKIAYNALPTQASDDFSSRQYFQAANQVELSDQLATSYETQTHQGTDFVFGVLTGYPCCTCNMHQAWPKFVQNLFYATSDGGVAALLYAPSTVDVKVADKVDLKIIETTGFPFRESVNFEFQLSKTCKFPFHFRIPSWTNDAKVFINGKSVEFSIKNSIVILNREWRDGDKISLELPMKIKTSTWHKSFTSVERGPLVYSLKIEDKEIKKDRGDRYGQFTEVFAVDDWNYGLIKSELDNLSKSIQVIEKEWDGRYPWNLENNPIELKLKGMQIPEWKTIDAAPIFPDILHSLELDNYNINDITLVPYGTTTLRITEFPTLDVN